MPQPPAIDDAGIDVVNAPQDRLGDLYHVMLRSPWSVTLLGIAALVLAVNVVHTYDAKQMLFGKRYADMLSPEPNGRVQLDYSKLHEVVDAPY
jgi:hypothetical protein